MPDYWQDCAPGKMRKMIIPSENDDGCDFCAVGGGAFSMKCRGCVIRWCSRLMRNHRIAIYKAVQEQHGEGAAKVFVADVKAVWAAERAQSREAKLASHASGLAAARGALL
jgi:hypothetical protein